MVRAYIKVSGIEDVTTLFTNLPTYLNKMFMAENVQIAKNIQLKARMNAPVATGFLRDSIKVKVSESEKSVIVETTAPYAQAREFGFTPHLVPIELIQQHYGSPGSTAGMHVPEGFKTQGLVMARNTMPFLRPAVESEISMLESKYRRTLRKTLVISRKGKK